MQPPVLEFGVLRPVLSLLVPFSPFLYGLSGPFVPSCPFLSRPVGLQMVCKTGTLSTLAVPSHSAHFGDQTTLEPPARA